MKYFNPKKNEQPEGSSYRKAMILKIFKRSSSFKIESLEK